jgi:hypothetical protein
MPLSCFVCGREFNAVQSLVSHLRNWHSLFEPNSLKCNAGGCCRTYSTYSSFRRHLISVHSEMLTESTFIAATGSVSEEEIALDNSELADSVQSDVEDKSCYPAVDSCGVPLAGANFLMNLCASNSMTLINIAFVKNTVK